MAQIKIVSSMAFDAICYLERRFLNDKNWLLPEEIEFIEKINELCGKRLGDDYLNMSTLCSILTIYAENSDFENYSLEDLAELFKNPENTRSIVKAKIINEFKILYTYPMLDWLVDGWAEKYTKMINILKEIGFDKLWESDLSPIIQKEIKNKKEKYINADIEAILMDIQKLKQCEPLRDIKIYVSFISYPTTFALHENSYLECIYTNSNVGMVCHELMHGFATKELTDLYLNYVKSIKYLSEQHDKLINEQCSGNEEEFVMAAEYYLRMKHNNENTKELLKEARNKYNGCVPTSVFLFALLSKEAETPNGYTQWLTDVFKNKKLPKKAIERNLNEVVPITNWEKFSDKQFGCFKRMLLKVQKIQKDPKNIYRSFNIEKKIEKVTNKKFEETDEKIVYFGQERQPLINAVKVKEMQIDNLFINIAEYKDIDKALKEWIDDTGSNMWPSSWHKTNFSCIGKTPATSSITFVINNFRISLTAKCSDYVNRGIDYPSNLKEYGDFIITGRKRIEKEGITWEQIDREINIAESHEEFCLKYSDEILSSQKKIEDIIMKL